MPALAAMLFGSPADAEDGPDAFGTRGIVPVSPSGEVGSVE